MTNTEKTYEEEYEEMTGEAYRPEDAEMAQIRAEVAEFEEECEEECEHEFEFEYEMPDGEYQRCRFCGEGHAFYYPYSRED